MSNCDGAGLAGGAGGASLADEVARDRPIEFRSECASWARSNKQKLAIERARGL
jgi:hypothetical protein